jgi:cell division transport system permease protein
MGLLRLKNHEIYLCTVNGGMECIMKTAIYNIGYFFSEAMRTIKSSPLSNLFSVLGTGLILFLLGLVMAGWSIGDQLITAIGKEAEVSAYFTDASNLQEAEKLAERIQEIDGVMTVSYVDEAMAHDRMEEMLGEEAGILSLFEENPFEAFLEIHIDLAKMDQVIAEVKQLEGIEYIRDNREVLNQMKQVTEGMKLIGLLMITAVGITTLIIISHMIRQGIYNNREQINTLRLLGAPNSFISFPFILAGTLLTLAGGEAAIVMIILLMNSGYDRLSGVIPFLPLPKADILKSNICLFLLVISASLGILGSLFGVSSIRKGEK